MQIAHKMNEELKRLALLIPCVLRIFEHRQIKLDLTDHAILPGRNNHGMSARLRFFSHVRVQMMPISGFRAFSFDDVISTPTQGQAMVFKGQKRFYRLGGPR